MTSLSSRLYFQLAASTDQLLKIKHHFCDRTLLTNPQNNDQGIRPGTKKLKKTCVICVQQTFNSTTCVVGEQSDETALLPSVPVHFQQLSSCVSANHSKVSRHFPLTSQSHAQAFLLSVRRAWPGTQFLTITPRRRGVLVSRYLPPAPVSSYEMRNMI